MEITGAVALVTGASSGIGAAVAVELAERGATVVLAARRLAELERVAARCQRAAPGSTSIVADLSTATGCDQLLSETVERVGEVDILVNNAGMAMHRPALDTRRSDVERLLDVNFLAAVSLAEGVLPSMVRRSTGSIVSVTSVAGYLPNPGEAAYGASKAALDLWSHGLRVELAGSGVHVGVLSPGPIDTEIWDKSPIRPRYAGRKFPPEMVARAVVRMIVRGSAHVTVPRRYGAVGVLFRLPVVGRGVRRGLVRYGAQRRDDAHGSGLV